MTSTIEAASPLYSGKTEKSKTGYFADASALIGKGKISDAIKLYDTAIRSGELSEEQKIHALMNIGICFARQKKYDNARGSYFRILTDNSSSIEAKAKAAYNAAISFAKEGNNDTALDILHTSVKAGIESKQIYNLIKNEHKARVFAKPI